MEAVNVPLDEIFLDPANVRRHSEKNLEAIMASLKRFGQQKPIVVNSENIVIAGNGTLEAAKALGWSKIAAVKTTLGGTEATAYAIADNRTAELAEWDTESLVKQLSALDLEDSALVEAAGFSSDELASLVDDVVGMKDGNTDPDDVPEIPEEPTAQSGQIWQLGDHRLMCGDSTSADDMKALMCGERASLWLTDPPYNVDYTGKTKDALKVANDSMSDVSFREFLKDAFELAFESMSPGASFYIWHADSEGYNFRGAVRDHDQVVRQCLIWKKQSMVMGRQDYHWQHEPCLYGWKAGAAHGWYTDRKQTTILEFNRPSRSADHPTMKPAELFSYLILNSSAPNSIVLDTFLGSGTSIISSEQTGRRCYGMELSPAYCDVIIQRWEEFTGKKAELVKGAKDGD